MLLEHEFSTKSSVSNLQDNDVEEFTQSAVQLSDSINRELSEGAVATTNGGDAGESSASTDWPSSSGKSMGTVSGRGVNVSIASKIAGSTGPDPISSAADNNIFSMEEGHSSSGSRDA